MLRFFYRYRLVRRARRWIALGGTAATLYGAYAYFSGSGWAIVVGVAVAWLFSPVTIGASILAGLSGWMIVEAIRAFRARTAYYGSNPPIAGAPTKPAPLVLTEEDKEFRRDVRGLITRLVDAEQAACAVFGRMCAAASHPYNDKQHTQLAYFATTALDSRLHRAADMQLLAQNIMSIDGEVLQKEVAKYLANGYRVVQLYIWRLGKELKFASEDLAKADVTSAWLNEDVECLRKFREIKLHPQASVLASTSEEVFATVGRKWQVGE